MADPTPLKVPAATPPAPEVTALSADQAAMVQARLAAIVESCDDAIVGKTLEGIVTSWNRGAERLFGYSASEVIGSSILLIIPPERRDEEAMILARLCRGERIEHFETERVAKSGERIAVSLTVSPIHNSRGEIVGASKVARDIRERRRIEEAQVRLMATERTAREQAQRANLIKDEFLSVLSHELRTPLSAIQAWGHLLAAGRAAPEEMRQAGEVIVRNTLVQRRVIDDLLDIGRIVSGRLRVEMEMVDPAQIAQAALDTIRPAALAHRIRIDAALEFTSTLVRADPARLQQVLWNLLSNAVKFTPEGGLVRVCMRRAGGQLLFSVSDDGKGIEADFLPRIFERFTQEDARPSRQQGGLGLGLAIAKQLMELQGGTIQAASPGPGRGATFTVALPLPENAAARGPRAPDPAWAADGLGGERPDLSGITVLLVDDEPDALESLGRVLTDAGAKVLTAHSAAAALELLGSKAPHVLVSDIGMPDTDGYELLRKVRALDGVAADLPAIALTAFARPSELMQSLRAGYIAHMIKPADPCSCSRRSLPPQAASESSDARHPPARGSPPTPACG
ncbi:MAG: PAS domain S-box protein [Proteobacteria bacterium]|nr:PAS domain S-box protein [Pseudomonadota bacterium]